MNLDIENEQEQSKLYKELCDKNNFIPACAKLAENYRLIMSRNSDEKSIKKAYLYLKKLVMERMLTLVISLTMTALILLP